MSAVQYLGRTLSVEVLKCRRTLVFWLAAGAPFFMVFLVFNIFYFKGHQMIGRDPNPWSGFLGMVGDLWGFFFFPMYITLQSVLLLSVEHQSNTWKHVYGLAVPRWSVYAGKLTLFTALIALSMLLPAVFTELAGGLLGLLKPGLGFGGYPAHAQLARQCLKLFLAGLGITAIQFYVSFRFRNFILPAGLGLLMTITTVALLRWEHIRKFPYAWPMVAWFRDSTEPALFTWEVCFSLILFAAVALAGYFGTARRDVG